jgi:cation diffusion facilitator CzcD-associated flavoprotein CzcO
MVAPPASEGNDIRGEEAGETAAPVPDLEGRPVLLVGGGAAGVVLVVQQAGDVGEVTLLARHPQVARPRVENYLHPAGKFFVQKSSLLKDHEHEIFSR